MRQVRGVTAAREFLRRSPLPLLSHGEDASPEHVVDAIISDVALRGDAALREYSSRFEGVDLDTFEVSLAQVQSARDGLDPELREALELAAERLRSFHEACLPTSWFDDRTGLGQRILPLDSVGVYVPGGTAAYPSTVLHTAIPAKVAGVSNVVMTSPPGKDGEVPVTVLAAAAIAGVDRLFKIGGAQAIAAMALGTQSVPRVDKIVGPGNIFVTTAKRRLFGIVGIEALHGPTETMVIADDTVDAEVCAADLLAQAEHDAMATPILVTTSEAIAAAVRREIERQAATLERKETALSALESRGLIALVPTVDDAIELANEFAPEHLCLMVRDPRIYADKVRHAGGLFLGEGSPEVLGDYNAGPSHVMPTGGTARFSSALGVNDFLKITSVVGLNSEKSQRLAGAAARLARAEGLTAHARAAELRLRTAKAGKRDQHSGRAAKSDKGGDGRDG